MFARTREHCSLILWGIFFFLGVIVSLTAQQEAFRVYVPVNEQGEPTGANYYISEKLSEILLASRNAEAVRKNWSITSAKYLCSFSFNAQPQQVPGPTLTNFRAIYEINLETENATIVLPNLPTFPEGVRWNGLLLQPALFSPPANDSQVPPPKQLLIHVERQQPGKHTLEVSLNPMVEQVDRVARRIVLPAIPKVADAVLELNLSPEMPTISVEESLGQISNEPGKQTVQLGPTEKLTLTWNDYASRSAQTVVETEQFYLLNAQPNQIGISVLHRFRITGEKIQVLDLIADPSLSPSGTPFYENPPGVVLPSFETASPDKGLTRLTFKEPIAGNLTLRVNYILRDFSGIGDVRFPQIPPSPYRVSQCWVGVSSVPTLEFDSLPKSTVNLDRFKQEWGTISDDRLSATYDVESLPSFWMLSIRAKKPSTHAQIRQAILVRHNRTDYIVETALESDVPRFSCSFFVPENLRIERVDARVVTAAISESYSYPIPIDWRICPPSPKTPSGARVLSILSESPFRERLEITFRGFFLTPADELTRDLTLIRLDQAETEEHQVDLFHDSSVVFHEASFPESWQKSEGLPVVKSELIDGIPYGTWSNDPSTSERETLPVRLRLTPNTLEVSGRQITRLSWNISTDRFETTTTFDLSIEHGELSTLRLRYDDRCEFPPVVVPATRTDEVFDEGERFVFLRFSQPLSGKTTLTLKAAVNVSSESVFLPKILPNEPFSIKHYVVLPTDRLGRTIQWEKNQLSPVDEAESDEILLRLSRVSREPETDSPSPVSPSLSTSENHEILTVSGPDFNALLVPTGSRPTVQLNDVHLYLRKNGYISGVSSFDLQGNGVDRCVLILPDSYELVSITSGGITTRGTPLAPGRWQFDLWSSQLPQKVEVVFQGWLTTQNGKSDEFLLPMYVSENLETLPMKLPSLESTNVLGTIWTLAMETPTQSRPLRFFVDQGAGDFVVVKEETLLPLSARDAIPCLVFMDLIRLSNMETMMSGISSNLNSSQADVAAWYSFWGRSWWGFRHELDSLLISLQIDRQMAPANPWKRSLFLAGNSLPKSMEQILDSTKKPDQIGLELSQAYEKAIPSSLQAQSREFENGVNESTAFAAFRTSYSENISYLFGISGGEVETLYVVSLPEQPTLWEDKTVQWTLGILAISGGIILVRWMHPRRLFRQYPFFVGHVVAILLWLFLPPGFLGLALLPLLWLAMLWPSWKRG